MQLTNVQVIKVYEEDLKHDMYLDKQFVILVNNIIEMFDKLLKNVENEELVLNQILFEVNLMVLKIIYRL